jgi:hypothetical protein
MNRRNPRSGSELFIVDNSDRDWKVQRYLAEWCELSKSIDIATAYFEIGALLGLDPAWQQVDQFRILMGDEVSARTKRAFERALQRVTGLLDDSIEAEKESNDFRVGVPATAGRGRDDDQHRQRGWDSGLTEPRPGADSDHVGGSDPRPIRDGRLPESRHVVGDWEQRATRRRFASTMLLGPPGRPIVTAVDAK